MHPTMRICIKWYQRDYMHWLRFQFLYDNYW